MHFPQQPSLPHTQGLADSAIDAAWAVMPPDSEIITTRLLPIVVGAHPRSEIADRPLANRLVAAIRQWQRQAIANEDDRLVPMVMTDLWYLNDNELPDGTLFHNPMVPIGNQMAIVTIELSNGYNKGEPTGDVLDYTFELVV
jgi:hypothetical protein